MTDPLHPDKDFTDADELFAMMESLQVEPGFAMKACAFLKKHELVPSSDHELFEGCAHMIAQTLKDNLLLYSEPTAWLRLIERLHLGLVVMDKGGVTWQFNKQNIINLAHDLADEYKLETFDAAWEEFSYTDKKGFNRDAVHALNGAGLLSHRVPQVAYSKPEASTSAEISPSILEDQLQGGLDERPELLDASIARMREDLRTELGKLIREDDEQFCGKAGELEWTLTQRFYTQHELDCNADVPVERARELWIEGGAWTVFYPEIELVLINAIQRCEANPKDESLASAKWSLVELLIENSPLKLKGSCLSSGLIEDARKELGELRLQLEQVDTASDEEHIRRLSIAAAASCQVIAHCQSLWSALKFLFLAFRKLGQPSVGADLRYWIERNDEPTPPPKSFSWLPNLISMLLHNFLGAVQQKDPNLVDIRCKMAEFFISRLKTKRGVEHIEGEQLADVMNLVEPDKDWRLGYVNAIRALKVNPKGKGHKALSWTRHHDPDPDVREAAKSAHREMRHGAKLPPNTSPRRPLFAAFWWLRRAHMEALAQVIDDRGAQRTLRKEVRHTTHKEKPNARMN